jgi:hypothetical protein
MFREQPPHHDKGLRLKQLGDECDRLALHSPLTSPILRCSELKVPPEIGDLGGECNVFSTS